MRLIVDVQKLHDLAPPVWSHISVPMHGYNPLFGREMAQIQPLTHTADPVPFFLAQKCFICCFVLP